MEIVAEKTTIVTTAKIKRQQNRITRVLGLLILLLQVTSRRLSQSHLMGLHRPKGYIEVYPFRDPFGYKTTEPAVTVGQLKQSSDNMRSADEVNFPLKRAFF